jgi:hypothetical protein
VDTQEAQNRQISTEKIGMQEELHCLTSKWTMKLGKTKQHGTSIKTDL